MESSLVWVFLAVAAAFFQAMMPLISEMANIRTMHLIFWLRLFSVLCMLPLMFVLEWPVSPVFYLCWFGIVVIVLFSDLIYFRTAAENGAGVTTRIESLSVFASFVLWTAISPDLFHQYLSTPVRTMGIILSLCGCIYFMFHLRHCSLSRKTFKNLTPVILFGAIVTVLGKMAMDHAPFHSGPYVYVFLQGVAVMAVYGALMMFKPTCYPRLEISRHAIIAGILMGAASMGHIVTKNYGFSLVENPAYVTVVGLTAPLWILLTYKLLGRKEEAHVTAGLGIVACAALLVAFTRF